MQPANILTQVQGMHCMSNSGHVIKHDTRYGNKNTKIKYSFFRLFCTINQLIGFNSNYRYVYLVKQELSFSSGFRF